MPVSPLAHLDQAHLLSEAILHVTSPLTSALVIFGTYKVSHLPKMRALLRANRILLFKGRRVPSPAAAVAAAVKPAPNVAQAVTPATSRGYASSADARTGGRATYSTLTRHHVAGPLGGGMGMGMRSLASASSPFAAMGSRPLGVLAVRHDQPQPRPQRQLGTVAQAVIDAISVESAVTGTMVPWSVAKFELLAQYAHDELHMDWWKALCATTLLFRFVVMPLNISLVRNTARLYLVRKDVKRLDEVMASPTTSDDEKAEAATELRKVFKEGKCHPFKNLASPFIFPPIFLSLFGAVLDISLSGLPGVSTEGALWFTDLSKPDPTRILPVVSGLTWLATIELASGKVFKMPPWMLSATRLGAVAFIPITENIPAGVFMFWITSNLFAMTRAWLLRQRPVARFFGIPEVNRI